jgi:hypothetical protein
MRLCVVAASPDAPEGATLEAVRAPETEVAAYLRAWAEPNRVGMARLLSS